jgi:hypothetical protein
LLITYASHIDAIIENVADGSPRGFASALLRKVIQEAIQEGQSRGDDKEVSDGTESTYGDDNGLLQRNSTPIMPYYSQMCLDLLRRIGIPLFSPMLPNELSVMIDMADEFKRMTVMSILGLRGRPNIVLLNKILSLLFHMLTQFSESAGGPIEYVASYSLNDILQNMSTILCHGTEGTFGAQIRLHLLQLQVLMNSVCSILEQGTLCFVVGAEGAEGDSDLELDTPLAWPNIGSDALQKYVCLLLNSVHQYSQ